MVKSRHSINFFKLITPSIIFLFLGLVLVGDSHQAFAADVPYSIIYEDGVTSNMPTDVDTTSMSDQVTMADNTPTRPGFEYLGWCNVIPTNNDGTDLCTGGTQYQPSATLTIDQTGTGKNFHFYAMWQELCAGQIKMQNLTSSSIATLLPNEHSTATVCDVRDGETYTIAKLKDGKYWMVENLNLAGGTVLSANDTDVTSVYISSYSAGDSRLAKSGDTLVLPASDTAGFNTHNSSYVYNSGNKTNCGANGQNTPCYSYYSWDAATLGSGRTIATENTDAPHSICPKGWRLPTSRTTSATNWQTTSDFYVMAHQYGLDSTTSTSESDADFYDNAGPGTIPNFLLAGYYSNGSFEVGGSRGSYWPAVSGSNTSRTRSLYFDSSSVNSALNNTRNFGFSVRCLFSGQ